MRYLEGNMTNFAITSPQEFMDQIEFDRAIPGEIFTKRPKSFPFERPPQITNVEEALLKVFESMTKEKNIRNMLGILEAKIPIDVAVFGLIRNMVTEGAIAPQAGVVMVPALTVMMARMAEAAGINFKLTSDDNDPITEDELNLSQLKKEELDINKAADTNQISQEELATLQDTDSGLLQKPEELS